MARIFLTLIILFLLQSNAQAQAPIPLKLSVERDTHSLLIMNKPDPENFNPLLSKDSNIPASQRIVTMTSPEAELHVNNFFEDEADKCSGKFHVGMYPAFGVCYQSKDKRVQFLGFTTGAKTEMLFLRKF